MKNPWLKKNPYLSMWLSGANAVLGSARSRAMAEGKRQSSLMVNKGAKEIANYWSDALTPPRKKVAVNRRRKKN